MTKILLISKRKKNIPWLDGNELKQIRTITIGKQNACFLNTSRDGILVFTELPGYSNHVVNYKIQQVTTWSKWPVYYRESEHRRNSFFSF